MLAGQVAVMSVPCKGVVQQGCLIMNCLGFSVVFAFWARHCFFVTMSGMFVRGLSLLSGVEQVPSSCPRARFSCSVVVTDTWIWMELHLLGGFHAQRGSPR